MIEKKKVSTTIEIPVGYSLAPGKQPRRPVKGDWIYRPHWERVETYHAVSDVPPDGIYYILEKELPNYTVVVSVDEPLLPGMSTKLPKFVGPHVQMVALGDALRLCNVSAEKWSHADQALYKHLKKLVDDYEDYISPSFILEAIKNAEAKS